MTTVTVELVRDPDGRWSARWPGWLVVQGRSAGAGRHRTRAGLVAAIEAAGWSVVGSGRLVSASYDDGGDG